MPAVIRSGLKKALLSAIFTATQDDTLKDVLGSRVSITSLQDGLTAYQSWLMSQGDVLRGKFTLTSAGFGHSVGYCTSMIWRATNEEAIFELSQDFLDLFDWALATLAANGSPSANDATIFATMKGADELNATDRSMSDMTVLRYSGSRIP